MKQRYLSVPVNRTGVDEYEYGIEKSENLYTEELPEKEFAALSGLFDFLNKECGLLIDDYESAIIPAAYFDICRKYIENNGKDTPVFLKMLEIAIENASMLALDF